MALLFVDSLTQNYNRAVQISVKILELLLLSTGLLTTLVMAKRAVTVPFSCELVFSSLVGFWSSFTCFLSSPLSICIIVHLMVLMIAVSSAFHRRHINPDDELTVGVHQHVMQIAESLTVSPPPPAAPPPTEENRGGKGGLSSVQFSDERITLEGRSEVKKPESSEAIEEKIVTADHPPPLSDRWKDVFVEKEEDETIEATWQAITGGGNKRAGKKSLKKSETWEVPPLPSPPIEAATCTDSSEPIEERTSTADHPPPSDEDTMEATWQAITGGGKPMPKKKNLKKSETWKAPPPSPPIEAATCTEDKIKKPAESPEPIEENTSTADYPPSSDEDTMEATWQAITGGGKKRAEKKNLKKSGTWEAPRRRSVAVQRVDSEELVPTTPKWRELRKAETFNDAVSIIRRGGLIRRGPSMSLEELNQQVEAFIKKFNDNMRLQRQESKQRFLDRINGRI